MHCFSSHPIFHVTQLSTRLALAGKSQVMRRRINAHNAGKYKYGDS
jgi:hypothetical protein